MHKRPRNLMSVLLILFVAMVAAAWRAAPAQAAAPTGAANTVSGIERNGDGSDDGGSADSSNDTSGDGDARFYGEIESMPGGDGQGSWVVGGRTFTADAGTDFEEDDGQFAPGACVKVEYAPASPTVASKIETEPVGDCDGSGNGGGDNDGDEDGDSNEIEVYGRVEVTPTTGLIGTWVIDGRTFTADADTEFEQEHGGLRVGVCVEVEADAATPTIAEKIETESSYKCDGGSDDDDDGNEEFHGEFYGIIGTLPNTPDLVGDWVVGGVTFVVTTTTELKDERAPFAVGVTVKVEFREDSGRKVATEIKSVFESDDQGDDDGNGSHDGHEGHAWGTIGSFPQDFLGTWTISGVEYIVNAETRLKQEVAPFAENARVKVKFYLNAQGQRVATSIKTTNGNGGTSDEDSKFVGFVEAKPAGTTLVGDWTIGGEKFVTTAQTKFEEDDGLLAIGTYVEVEYQLVDGKRAVKEMDTDVPPGAGDDDAMGKIEDIGDDNPTAAALAPGTSVWRIGGAEYTVTPATDLNEAQGALEVGGTAVINSLTAADGSRTATRIAGMTIAAQVYLPVMTR